MRSVTGLVAVLLGVLPAGAGELPDVTACPEPVAAIATCYGAKLASGAFLLAAMPKDWNGNLVVFAHGGPAVIPPTANTSKADLAKYAGVVQAGYAWIASSYRKEGYGVRMAGEDTEDARAFFVERIGKPRRTIMHGASYGGLVGAKLMEAQGKNADGSARFDGAFFNSGFVIGAAKGHEFRLDLRVVYQYYCKNLPRPDTPQYPLWAGLPIEARMTLNDLIPLVDECTGITKAPDARTDTQKRNLANILAVMRFPPTLLIRNMQAATFLFREISERTTKGRNAFSNIGVRYRGSDNDEELNKLVARYEADPSAVAALKADGEPGGATQVPVVSIHSMNDPQVAVEVQAAYRDAVKAAGSGDRLVQAYTDERGHTAQSVPEILAAIDSLMQWIDTGARPTPQAIAAACEHLSARFKGACSYHPDYVPKPYATRYARGAAGQ